MSVAQEAAMALFQARSQGYQGHVLPEAIRPRNEQDVLAIHRAMATQQAVVGYKCVMPLDDGNVVAAPIFYAQQGQYCELIEDLGVARVELEICFVLAKDLPANASGYSKEDISNAIASAHMALELMQDRFIKTAEPSHFDKHADCMFNQGLYLGPEIALDTAMQANELVLSMEDANGLRHFDGKHPNQCAGKSVFWIIDYLAKNGVSFTAGQGIITGSFCGIVDAQFDTPTTIIYEGLGEYSVTFKRRA